LTGETANTRSNFPPGPRLQTFHARNSLKLICSNRPQGINR